jgi:Class II Aldolase and Adducin N-terminal domain
MDNRERDGRVELAAAFRLAVRLGFHEGVCNHFSLALSDDGREFLVNPHGRHFGELRARSAARRRGRPRARRRRRGGSLGAVHPRSHARRAQELLKTTPEGECGGYAPPRRLHQRNLPLVWQAGAGGLADALSGSGGGLLQSWLPGQVRAGGRAFRECAEPCWQYARPNELMGAARPPPGDGTAARGLSAATAGATVRHRPRAATRHIAIE